jgi:phage/plasmid-associated DNA primase
MSNQFKRVFEEIRARLTRQIADSHDANYKAEAELANKKLSALIHQLDDRTFKNKVLSEVLDMLHVDMERFEDIIDTNGSLTGVPNGVIEVDYDAKTIEFRPGKPEDYMTRCTLARFIDLGWEHPRVIELMNWLGKMFVDDETRHFVLKILGSGFIAGNLDKFAPIFTGNVNNSKSALVRAMMYTWGSYAVKFPTTGLTRGYSDSGAPNPAWARLDKVRWAFADEPDERECYRSGPFKVIYGNDAVYNRKLFSDGADVEASATVITSCNRVPPFPNADTASIERLCLIPCLSTWVKPDKLPTTAEEQLEKRLFPMDKNFINRVRLLGPALLWVSFQYFTIWAEEKLDQRPPEVQKATAQYWRENDIYLMYTADRIEAAPSTTGLTMIELYNDFELWFNKYNKNSKLPDRATVREHFISRWEHQPSDNVWWGIKIKDEDVAPVKKNKEEKGEKEEKVGEKPKAKIVVNRKVSPPKKVSPAKVVDGEVEPIEVTDLGFPVIKESAMKSTGKKMRVVVRNGKLITESEEIKVELPTIESQ